MKIPCLCFAAITLTLFTKNMCYAQSTPVQFNLKPPPANIAVDGDLKKWGDSLNFYSPEERISYELANTKDTLYLAIKIYDKTEIDRVLHAGLTFTIDPKGKKKEAYSLTYPLNMQGSARDFVHHTDENETITQDDRDELLQERITTLRGIKVVGFKDIEDDMITTSNTYGILAIINYDAAGNLIYEEAIPLKFFHADNAAKTLWAFNIKINGLQRPETGEEDSGGGHRGGGRGGGGRHGGGGHRNNGGNNNTDRGEMFKSVDFWGKFYLAQ